MKDPELLKMLADHMEGGFLENIIDMFKHDRGLYTHVPSLMADERSRVRIGVTALVEELRDVHRGEAVALIPEIADLLGHENPTLRADAAYLLEVIGHGDALPYLEKAADDESEAVRGVIRETIDVLSKGK